jgi:hypothetical protein
MIAGRPRRGHLLLGVWRSMHYDHRACAGGRRHGHSLPRGRGVGGGCRGRGRGRGVHRRRLGRRGRWRCGNDVRFRVRRATGEQAERTETEDLSERYSARQHWVTRVGAGRSGGFHTFAQTANRAGGSPGWQGGQTSFCPVEPHWLVGCAARCLARALARHAVGSSPGSATETDATHLRQIPADASAFFPGEARLEFWGQRQRHNRGTADPRSRGEPPARRHFRVCVVRWRRLR